MEKNHQLLTEELMRLRADIKRQDKSLREAREWIDVVLGQYIVMSDKIESICQRDLLIENSHISTRLKKNLLDHMGLTNWGQVSELKHSDFLKCRNFGKKTLDELQYFCGEMGIKINAFS